MTEKQARKRYGKDVLTLRQYFKNIPLPQMLGETTGLCKLIIRGNGEILGAHIVGLQASEFIGVVALAMKEKIKLSHTTFTSPNLTSSEILHQLAWQWQSDRLLRNKTLQKLLETWFIWRRR